MKKNQINFEFLLTMAIWSFSRIPSFPLWLFPRCWNLPCDSPLSLSHQMFRIAVKFSTPWVDFCTMKGAEGETGKGIWSSTHFFSERNRIRLHGFLSLSCRTTVTLGLLSSPFSSSHLCLLSRSFPLFPVPPFIHSDSIENFY